VVSTLAEWGIHFTLFAVLLNVRVAGHTPGEESDRSDAENSQQHDHTDHNEDNFQRSASLTRHSLEERKSPERYWA